MALLGQRAALAASRTMRTGAALFCLAVTAIHVIDQGGFPGSKTPRYVGIGYYLVEAAGIVAAILLLRSCLLAGWLLAGGVAVGPLVGYLLSRGPGLPDYTEDVGNWSDPLGVASLVVEGVLLTLVLSVLGTIRCRTRR